MSNVIGKHVEEYILQGTGRTGTVLEVQRNSGRVDYVVRWSDGQEELVEAVSPDDIEDLKMAVILED